jgi:diadenosine tetraphosphatase ApaH/serine/threonine PP2A family protein phosphatase
LFLASLPVTLTLPGFQIVHGSLRQPLEEYLFTLTDALTCFTLMKEPLLFVGHTHKPAIAFQTPTVVDGQRLEDNQPVKIDSYEKVIINVGSVGQPRDGDPRASFGVYHQESRQFALKRVEYNIPAVQADMRQKNLPTFLIERLSSGK